MKKLAGHTPEEKVKFGEFFPNSVDIDELESLVRGS